MKRNTATLLSILTSTLMLSACGGSSTEEQNTAGRISLNITYAPVDNANEVVVEFTSVTLKPNEGNDIVFDFEDGPASLDVDESKMSIDLLALQGLAS